MDWSKNDACLSSNDSAMNKVFKYNPSSSTVVEILEHSSYEPRIAVLTTDEEWRGWASRVKYDEQGLILMYAAALSTWASPRSTIFNRQKKSISIDNWLAEASEFIPTQYETRRDQILSPLAEKSSPAETPISKGVSTVPFSRDTFKFLSEKLQIHESIGRTISRSDVPTFTVSKVTMGDPAFVYGSRTSNAWAADLALSQTYYPERGLSISVLYGCDLATSVSVMKRLREIGSEASHPLLMPGILAELEYTRQVSIVDSNVATVETKILELDTTVSNTYGTTSSDCMESRVGKRNAWLNLAYLRNTLVLWEKQLSNMVDHVDELKSQWRQRPTGQETHLLPAETTKIAAYIFSLGLKEATAERVPSGSEKTNPTVHLYSPEGLEDGSYSASQYRNGPEELIRNSITAGDFIVSNSNKIEKESCGYEHRHDSMSHKEKTKEFNSNKRLINAIGDKIKHRLHALQAEYDDMIRSCDMRLEGMAMATQWAHSETNVEIAQATNRDSRIMKSISLVTMIFLPGTFFATVFSMTFFDWFGDSENGDNTRISSYVWIYVVITAFFTAVTVASWYYFVIHRRKSKAVENSGGAV